MAERPEGKPEIELPLNTKISLAVDGFEPALKRYMQKTTDANKNEPAKELIYRIECELDTKLSGDLRDRIASVLTSTITTSTVVEGETLKTDVDLKDLINKLEFTLRELGTSGT